MSSVSERAASIFVLEDDSTHQLLLQHEFQGDRYAVTMAGDAAEAMDLISKDGATFDLGIFDLKVPEKAGDPAKDTGPALQVIETARRRFPAMTILTISSVFLGEELRRRMEDLSVKEIFAKPFSLEKLHEFVDASH